MTSGKRLLLYSVDQLRATEKMQLHTSYTHWYD